MGEIAIVLALGLAAGILGGFVGVGGWFDYAGGCVDRFNVRVVPRF